MIFVHSWYRTQKEDTIRIPIPKVAAGQDAENMPSFSHGNNAPKGRHLMRIQ
jgi:hypothetical protein